MDYQVYVTDDAYADLDRCIFQRHRYFMSYRIEGDIVVVDNIFHKLQGCQNKMV